MDITGARDEHRRLAWPLIESLTIAGVAGLRFVVRFGWSWVGTEGEAAGKPRAGRVVTLASGHSPFLSVPQQLAQVLVSSGQ